MARTDLHAPDSLKYQWRLHGLVVRSDWATGLDKSISYEIIDNYKKEFGNSRASLTYLQNATKADRKSVIASVRRLVEHGPFSVARHGAGTRATEYLLDFDVVADNPSSGVESTTSQNAPSSGVCTTTGSGVGTTTSAPSSGVCTTESVLHVPAYKDDVHVERNFDPAAPTAPLPSFPIGAEVAVPAEGFDSLWIAYGHRQKKAEAKAAYKKLHPDAEMQARLVVAATAWRMRWEEQGNPQAARYTLAKWLEREEFECDPPAGYKAKAPKARSSAANSNRPAAPARLAPAARLPSQSSRVVEVVASEVAAEGRATVLRLSLRREDGATETMSIDVESNDAAMQARGQRRLGELASAAGLDAIDDAVQLHGRRFTILADGEIRAA